MWFWKEWERHALNGMVECRLKVINTNMTDFEGGGDAKNHLLTYAIVRTPVQTCQRASMDQTMAVKRHWITHNLTHERQGPCANVCQKQVCKLAQVRRSVHVCPSSRWHCAAGLFWFLKDRLRWVRRCKNWTCWHALAEWHHLLSAKYTPVDF